jgi:enamine deaminase RidA (YjgF/YER057c/UK114 family)
MRGRISSKLKSLSIILGLELLASLLAAFLVIPFLSAAGNWGGGDLAALVFVFAAVFSIPIYLLSSGSGVRVHDFVDAMASPAVVIDANDCYALINPPAANMLNLNKNDALGKKADSRLLNLLRTKSSNRDLFSSQNILKIGNRGFKVLEHGLPFQETSGPQARVLVFHDVTSLISLKSALREIDGNVESLSENATKLSNSSMNLSQSVTEQAASLSAISTGMNQVSGQIQGNAESAVKGTQLAAQAREAAERSGSEITNALSAMTDVQEAGIRIARIVKLIDDIAFQTNLLALNAAVEAARAGRQGKGFAVVADEVRNLAGRSAKAAKDTASMVEDVTERIGNAGAYISKLKEILGNIVQDAIHMADYSAASSATSTEQASSILSINRELGQMNTANNSIIGVAEQSTSAVVMLTSQINALKNHFNSINQNFFTVLDRNESPFADSAPDNSPINLLEKPDSYDWKTNQLSDNYFGGQNPGTGDLEFSGDFGNDRQPNWLAGGGFANPSGPGGAGGKPLVADANLRVGEGKIQYGDRMVRPSQHIVLDDSEFGRY